MSHLESPPNAPPKSGSSKQPAYGASWLIIWIEALLVFAAGVAVPSLVGWTGVTFDQVWRVGAIAAGALSLGFGAAYLLQQARQNSVAAMLEVEFQQTSARIDALATDHAELEHKVRKEMQADRRVE